jgi:predicted phage-related endonuclease
MIHQKTQAWKDLRVGKFTASLFGDCMGTGKAKGRDFTIPGYTLIQEKIAERLTGQQKEITGKALEWGEAYEEEAVALYEKVTGEKVAEAPFVPLENYEDDAGGSPDGFIEPILDITDIEYTEEEIEEELPPRDIKYKGICEIKCPWNSANHIESLETGDVPAKYERKYFTQMQFNMMVTKTQYCDFVSYDPRIKNEDLKIVIKRIPADKEYQVDIMTKLDLALLHLKGKLAVIELRTKSNLGGK